MLFVNDRETRDEFLRRLKQEWRLMWKERFDDKHKAEGITMRDYPLLLMDRGLVIFASRNAKAPSFSEIKNFWVSQGLIYSPDPAVGGWRKFISEHVEKCKIRGQTKPSHAHANCKKQQLKKGGRGWLHIE